MTTINSVRNNEIAHKVAKVVAIATGVLTVAGMIASLVLPHFREMLDLPDSAQAAGFFGATLGAETVGYALARMVIDSSKKNTKTELSAEDQRAGQLNTRKGSALSRPKTPPAASPAGNTDQSLPRTAAVVS